MQTNMKKETFYRILIGILLVLNLMQIGFFLFTKPPHPPKHRFKGHAHEILHLTEDQSYQFRNIADAHHKNMKFFDNEERKWLTIYFKEGSEESLNELERIHQQKIEFTKAHFEDVKAMLNEDQLPYFEPFKEEVLKKIMK